MNEKRLEKIKSWMDKGYEGRALAYNYTRYMDRFLSDIFYSVDKQTSLVLLATGGYGREELAPFSDIDVMFFAHDRSNTETAESILYALWDCGLEISHTFRTPDECIDEAFKDIRTRTSLLETRYIAGDKTLYNTFSTDVYPVIAYKRRRFL